MHVQMGSHDQRLQKDWFHHLRSPQRYCLPRDAIGIVITKLRVSHDTMSTNISQLEVKEYVGRKKTIYHSKVQVREYFFSI